MNNLVQYGGKPLCIGSTGLEAWLEDYTVKKGYHFSRPSPAEMSLTKIPLAGNY
jgi:hypothetical protein